MERNSEKKLFLLLQRKISPFLAILTRYKLLYRPAKEMYILSLVLFFCECDTFVADCSQLVVIEWAGRAQRQEGGGVVVLLDVFFPLQQKNRGERDGPCVTTTPLHLFSSKKKRTCKVGSELLYVSAWESIARGEMAGPVLI